MESSEDGSSSDSESSIEQVFEKQLKRHEKHDMTATLDHLVAVGSKWEQAAQRRVDLTTPMHEKHQEDERLYSKTSLQTAGRFDCKNRK